MQELDQNIKSLIEDIKKLNKEYKRIRDKKVMLASLTPNEEKIFNTYPEELFKKQIL